MSPASQRRYDTIVLGGGVAALWTANVLKHAGQRVLVLSNAPFGEGQSLAAQGVIHGGLKYALGGKLTEASEALSTMPERWLSALRGDGPVDLSRAKLLSDHQILWSLPNVFSQALGLFGSKALRGRSRALSREEYPPVFDSPAYKGRLFHLDEPVVDPVTVLRELANGVAEASHLVRWGETASLLRGPEGVAGIRVREENGKELELQANAYVLAAGAGNAELLSALGMESPGMQRRPLHQVVIRRAGLPDFFSVCIGTGAKPPLVCTTHVDSGGRSLWYLGGDLAESEGVARSESEQIAHAQAFFAKRLPWIEVQGAEWFTIRVDRAEPRTASGERPPGAYCQRVGNVLVTWPSKFALAPDLADQVSRETRAALSLDPPPLHLPRPALGRAPWDRP